jgi:sulfide:quinone oxidoreductase
MPIPAADHRDGLRVLVAGGGVGALETALALRAQAAHVQLTLLAPEAVFSYRHLAVGEPFGLAGGAAYELQAIADDRGFAFVHDGLERVDANEHAILTRGGARLGYDRLVLALGAHPVAVVPGALPFRGPADVDPLAEALRELATGAPRRVLFAAPTQVGWTLPLYELALMNRVWGRQQDLPLDVVLASPERARLEAFGPRGEEATALKARAGVTFLGGVMPERVKPDGLRPADGGSVPADRVVALPGCSDGRRRGCRAIAIASSRSTTSAACAMCRTSSRSATWSAVRSSRAASPASRRTQPPARSPSRPARTCGPSRSGRCSARSC